MAKSYSEELAKWVKQRPAKTKREKNVVAFLAVRDDVREALGQGYPVSTIWAHMHEMKRVEFRYEMFLHYVNRHIRRPQQEKQPSLHVVQVPDLPAKKAQARQPPPAREKPAPTGKPSTSTAPAGFTFNAAPNKEELL
ncbi:hypothetical protein CR103_15605 [Massilia psychrophila]|uniref:TraK n=2 Tax=Massilia psychrophila TaxID=1603353 RepID=A0A2G8SYM1_9BURK|nr:hypothetical protein CR103_15605 [Massilia psychrophila]